METVGLLAGIGILPVEFIEAAHIQGYKVVCIAVIPGVEKKLKEKADAYYEISVFKLNKVIKTLLSEGVQEVTMLGKVTKEWLYKDHVIPDLRALKVLNRLRKKNFKDDTITLELVEAIEGTDACIRRGGMLARGGAVVVKTAKPDQDLRFDVPAVGLETLHSMMETGCKVLAIEAYRTLFVEKTSVLKEADCAGIAILSVEQEHL